MFSPVANGINPKMVVIAVKITGRKRAAPPFTMASLASILGSICSKGIPNSSFFRAINNWV